MMFSHDVFIVHAAADEWFVQAYLLDKLRLPPDRVLLPTTLELGKFLVGEIERGVRSSRVTIVVLSPACLADDWAMFGEQIAVHASASGGGHGLLLPLLLQDCDVPAHIQALVKLDFRSPAREAWEAEAARIGAYFDRPDPAPQDLPCPYPGMRPFTGDDARRFFGRGLELDRILRKLRHGERELYVIGASGSGKSSLIAAGLVPRLVEGVDGLPRCHVASLRPGERPLERLAAAVQGDAAELPAAPAAIDRLLARHAPATALVLVVDQLEEVFAIADPGQRDGFLAALQGLRSDPRCTLIFTLRADFYGAFMASSLWRDHDGGVSRVELGPLQPDALRMVIERPARELGVYLQPELLTRLLDDAALEPGALPLLQETLFQLWGKRRQRLLALAEYHALGDGTRTGLAFAIKEHADGVFGALTAAQKPIALRILLRLVNFGDGRADTRRQQICADLRSSGETVAELDAVVRHLVDHRLLTVTGDDQRADARVDLAHEILIQAWPTFADWIRTWRPHEQRRRELEAAAAAWRARGGGDGGLLDAVELASARAWRERAAHELGESPALAAFLAASETAQSVATRQHRRRLRIAVAAIALFAAVVSTLAVVALHSANQARENATEANVQRRKVAEQRLEVSQQRLEVSQQRDQREQLSKDSSRLYEEAGQQKLQAERPLQALPYLVAAREAGEANKSSSLEALRKLFEQAMRNLPLAPPLPHQAGVMTAAFSPDGMRVVTASRDHTAQIWETASGKSSATLAHDGDVVSAAFSPDGARVVTASWDHTARVWDAATGKPLSPPLPHGDSVVSAAFSPDGTRVVTASWDHTARIWNATSGAPVSPPLAHQDIVNTAAFSPDGTRIVTASADRTARIWSLAGQPLSPPLEHKDRVVGVAFSPDGARVVTASVDHTARIWDAASGKPLSPALEHLGAVVSAVFDASGTRVVTASEDATARIWDAISGKPLSPALEHLGAVRTAVFSGDGAAVVTASDDRSARIWTAASGTPPSPPSPPFTPGKRILNTVVLSGAVRAITRDHTVARIWDVGSGKPLSPPIEAGGRIEGAAFSADGARVVLVTEHAVQVWNAVSGQPISPPIPHPHIDGTRLLSTDGRAVFSRDGGRFVMGLYDTARVWDAATGKPISAPFRYHDEPNAHVAFSRDGTRVLTYDTATARVWDAASGNPISPVLDFSKSRMLTRAELSPDGGRIVTVGPTSVQLWDVASGRKLPVSFPEGQLAFSAVFSPDGTRIVMAGDRELTRVWDAVSGRPLSPPLASGDKVWQVAFSADGTRVMTSDDEYAVRVWDAASGRALSPPIHDPDWVNPSGMVKLRAMLSPDGMRVVTVSPGTVRIWSVRSTGLLSHVVKAQDSARTAAATGSLDDWRAIAQQASPYVLTNGTLSTTAAPDAPTAPPTAGRP